MTGQPAGVRFMLQALAQDAADDKVAAMTEMLANMRRNVRAVQKPARKSS